MQGGPMRQAKLTNYFQKLSKTPLMISIDGEWGLAMRLDSTPQFPRQMTLGAIQNDSLIYEMGKEIALECKRLGIQVNFAPVADVNNNPNNPVISMRSFGEDKYLVARKAEMYMRGMQDQGVLANGKHFPGHGDTDKDSHKTLPTVPFSIERLDSLELYPFRYLMDRGLGSVMVGHLYVPAIDSTKDQASTLSTKIVTGLLKEKLGYQGLIFTDALNMKGASAYNEPGQVDAKALLAGNDMLLFTENVEKAVVAIKKALATGELKQEDIDAHCKKILKAKYWCGLSKNKFVKNKNLVSDLNNPRQELLRTQLAEASMTLLQNKQQLLPLKSLDTLKIACVSIGVEEQNDFSTWLGKYFPVQHFGINHTTTKAKTDTLLKAILNCNLVIVQVNKTGIKPDNNFGFTASSDSLLQQILQTKKTILTFFSNPYLLGKIKNLEKAEAILEAYEYNSFSQKAAAEAIAGAITINGKMPVSSAYFKRGCGIELSNRVRIQYISPEGTGIEKKKLQQIDSIALKGIKDKCYPGCRILAVKNGKVFYDKSFGYFTYEKTEPVTVETVYDLASVTKISATALALMQLRDKNSLDVNKRVEDYLPETKNSDKGNLLLCDVLTHQSGLEAWIPFYKVGTDTKGQPKPDFFSSNEDLRFTLRVAEGVWTLPQFKDSIFLQILKSKLKEKGKYVYSDLGYYFHQRIIEKKCNQPINDVLQKNFYDKLGLQTMMYNPSGKIQKARIAPTENNRDFRKQLLRGDVHDPGAALMGGVAGHAGLFSDANDLAVVMQMLLNGGMYGGERYLDSSTVNLFAVKSFVQNNRRGLCFDKPETDSKKESPVADVCSAKSFGHSGFTGTFAWADPETKLVFIFLSNRVYPSAEDNKLAKSGIRSKIHQMLYEATANSKL
jgi:beta-N-acetylhexosaminidase